MALFQQQGEMDWVAMSNSIFSSSYLVAQRVAWAGIQPLTFQAGLAMCTNFRLGQMGHMRVSDALNNLRPYYGMERALWFGFGHKSFLTLLAETEAGFNCAALCGALAEAYGIDRASQLLQALWKAQGLSSSLEPSRSQFRALVNGCSGLLLASPFPDVLARMAGSAMGNLHFRNTLSSRSDDWAKAVKAIFQISKGDLRAIRIHGCSDIAFLGALAHWLFDLSIWLELPDGTTVFTSCRYPEQAHVSLLFEGEEQSALVYISTTTFVLRSIEDLITDDSFDRMTFRVRWSSCLADVFNETVNVILGEAALLGRAIGAISRIYQALKDCERDVGGLSRTHFMNFRSVGYGLGYIDHICRLFPELGNTSVFRPAAIGTWKEDVHHCTEIIIESIKNLINTCPCRRCSRIMHTPLTGPYLGCNIVVLPFLRTIGNTMACVDIKGPISPSWNGLNNIVSRYSAKWSHERPMQDSKLIELATGLPHSENSNAGNGGLLDSILQEVANLFAGQAYDKKIQEFRPRPRDEDQPQCTALVKNGICIWIDALRDLTADAASMSTIHVAPGQIIYNNWTYTSIWDSSHACREISNNFAPADFWSTPTTHLEREPNQPYDRLLILAEERAQAGTIKLVYELCNKPRERMLQPGILTEEILVATARVPCSHTTTCSDAHLAIPCWQRKSGWEIMESGIVNRLMTSVRSGSTAFLYHASSPLAKLLAIEGCRISTWYHGGHFDSSIIICSDQCMACMTRYVKNYEHEAKWEQLLYYKSVGRWTGDGNSRPTASSLYII